METCTNILFSFSLFFLVYLLVITFWFTSTDALLRYGSLFLSISKIRTDLQYVNNWLLFSFINYWTMYNNPILSIFIFLTLTLNKKISNEKHCSTMTFPVRWHLNIPHLIIYSKKVLAWHDRQIEKPPIASLLIAWHITIVRTISEIKILYIYNIYLDFFIWTMLFHWYDMIIARTISWNFIYSLSQIILMNIFIS